MKLLHILSISFLLLSFCHSSQVLAQYEEPFVQGRVTDLYGTPLAEVEVSRLGSDVIVKTNDNGFFNMTVPKEQIVRIRFSHWNHDEEDRVMWLRHGDMREINPMLRPSDLLIVGSGYQKPTTIVKKYEAPKPKIDWTAHYNKPKPRVIVKRAVKHPIPTVLASKSALMPYPKGTTFLANLVQPIPSKTSLIANPPFTGDIETALTPVKYKVEKPTQIIEDTEKETKKKERKEYRKKMRRAKAAY